MFREIFHFRSAQKFFAPFRLSAILHQKFVSISLIFIFGEMKNCLNLNFKEIRIEIERLLF